MRGMMNYIVIMAGGAGTRLWPLSRKNSPKQLQKLVGDKSMVQETFERLKKIVKPKNIYISTRIDCLKDLKKQLPQIPQKNYIVEPVGRNTAPAMGLIAQYIYMHDRDAVVTTIASDHIVNNQKNFLNATLSAQEAISKNPTYVCTIGIKPTSAHTGYGYIEKDQVFAKINGQQVFKVKQFVEKPDLNTAKKYLDSRNFYWNASYFTWQAKNLLEILKKHQPDIYQHLQKLSRGLGTAQEKKVLEKEFSLMPELAFDYIVEQLDKVLLIPADLGWDDIGSWASLLDIMQNITKKEVIERGKHLGIDNKNILVYAQDKLVTTIGLENVIIIDTPDVVLVCDKNRSQDVKKIVDLLKKKGKYKYL